MADTKNPITNVKGEFIRGGKIVDLFIYAIGCIFAVLLTSNRFSELDQR